MAGFLLIHGAFHGGWCFDPVAEILRGKGHLVSAPDLPGMGGSEAELRAASLDSWAEFTLAHCRNMRAELGGDPLVLAGHSRGGMVIGAAAQADPSLMDALVYICAMMHPEKGADEVARAAATTSQELLAHVFQVENGAGLLVDPTLAPNYFAQLSPPALAREAADRLVAEPVGPFRTPPEVTSDRWGRLPRTYVECLHDRAIPLESQRAMIAMAPGTRTVTLDADHSPFYSAPKALADALVEAAET